MNGIAMDIGSAYSMAARLNREGIPTLIGDAQESDQFRTPSLVHLGASGALVGQAAEIASLAQPESPMIQDAKSMLASGRTLAVDDAKKNWSAEECVGLLLSKLRQDANASCFGTVDEVVLTVPSRFSSAQRRALRQVAHATGLRVRALVDESLAAATYAASLTDVQQTVLVLQSGRCGFEAAVVRCSKGGASLIAARHDSWLGGKAIDQRLAEEICAVQGWARGSLSQAAEKQLLDLAEQLKIALCESSTSQVQRQGFIGKSTIEFILTSWHFEQLIAPMLDRVSHLIEKCLAEAELDGTNIDRVLLVGGTTQMPALRRELVQRFGLPSERIANKDCLTAVVYGAALLAAMPDEQLAKYDSSHTMSEMAAEPAEPGADGSPSALLDIGIRIGDPRSGKAAIYKLIKRGTALPAAASKQFRTSRADQTRLIIEAVRTTGSIRRAESLGHFALALPKGLPANHPVTVTMYCDPAGQIRVEAESTPRPDIPDELQRPVHSA